MNEKIRARIEQMDERTIANMANDLEATRITSDIKGVCTERIESAVAICTLNLHLFRYR